MRVKDNPPLSRGHPIPPLYHTTSSVPWSPYTSTTTQPPLCGPSYTSTTMQPPLCNGPSYTSTTTQPPLCHGSSYTSTTTQPPLCHGSSYTSTTTQPPLCRGHPIPPLVHPIPPLLCNHLDLCHGLNASCSSPTTPSPLPPPILQL